MPVDIHKPFRVGDWTVDPMSGDLAREGVTVTLEPRTVRLLQALASRPGEVLSVQLLLEEVWADVIVTPDSVYQAITALRRTLGDNAREPTYISTVARRGYRLVATVGPLEAPTLASVEPTTNFSVRPQRWSTPRRIKWLLVCLLALTVIGLALFREQRLFSRFNQPEALSVPVPVSVAVLPFVDLSERHDQGYFADGLTEELIDQLVRVGQLYVPARTSSFYFKDRKSTIAEIARQLHVTHVLEGSIRKSQNRIRITAQLIRVDSGYHVWSQSYDLPLADVFRTQDEIATSVMHALQATLMPSAPKPLHLPNTQAYEAYLKARALFESGPSTNASYQEQLSLLDEAIRIDPEYARAYGQKASVWVARSGFGFAPLKSGFEAARVAALQAIALDGSDPVGHVALAKIHMLYDWDWKEARREMDEALRLDPHDAYALRAAGQIADAEGALSDAVVFYQRAITKDPLASFTFYDLGVSLHSLGRLDDAKVALQRAIELNEGSGQSVFELATVLLDEHDFSGATVMFDRSDPASRAAGKVMLDCATGRVGDAERDRHEAERLNHGYSEFTLAEVFAFCGDHRRALDALERSVTAHEIELTGLRTDPYLRGLRGDPTFRQLAGRVGITL